MDKVSAAALLEVLQLVYGRQVEQTAGILKTGNWRADELPNETNLGHQFQDLASVAELKHGLLQQMNEEEVDEVVERAHHVRQALNIHPA